MALLTPSRDDRLGVRGGALDRHEEPTSAARRDVQMLEAVPYATRLGHNRSIGTLVLAQVLPYYVDAGGAASLLVGVHDQDEPAMLAHPALHERSEGQRHRRDGALVVAGAKAVHAGVVQSAVEGIHGPVAAHRHGVRVGGQDERLAVLATGGEKRFGRWVHGRGFQAQLGQVAESVPNHRRDAALVTRWVLAGG